jgi:hypothetical protein
VDLTAESIGPDGIDLRSDAILLRVTIRMMTPFRRSRRMTAGAIRRHRTDAKSVTVAVELIPRHELSGISRAARRVRSVLKRYSLPWNNANYRLVPLALYAQVTEEISAAELAFNAGIEDLALRRDQLAADYARRAGEEIAAEVPFPSGDSIRAGFCFAVSEMPVLPTTDIRLRHVDPAWVERMQREVASEVGARLNGPLQTYVENLNHLVAQIPESTPGQDSGLARSILTSLGLTLDAVRRLNIGGDPNVEALIDRVRVEVDRRLEA